MNMLRTFKLIAAAILLALFMPLLPFHTTARSRSDQDTCGSRHHVSYNRDANHAGAVQTEKEKKQLTVAILLFDRVEIIDFAGPWEVFGGAGYKVFTVAEKTDPVNT